MDLYLKNYRNEESVHLNNTSLDLPIFEKQDQYYNIDHKYYHDLYPVLNGLAHNSHYL